MSGNRKEWVRKALQYPVKLLATFGFFGSLKFVAAYLSGKPALQLKPRRFSRPVWIRPGGSDVRVIYEIFTLGELEFPWPLASAPRRIIDAGANVGYATLALKERWPACEIVALEPDKGNFEILRRNCGDLPGVRLMKKGVWSDSLPLRVEAESLTMGAWALRFEPCDSADPGAVQAISIGDLLDEMGWEDCDLLKMDVEGAEIPIFKRTGEWLPKTRSVLVEAHGDEALMLVKQASEGRMIREEGEKFLLWLP